MTSQPEPTRRFDDADIQHELQRHPHLMLQLAENALTIAESLRDNYFRNTAKFVTALRRAVQAGASGRRPDPPLTVQRVGPLDWEDVAGEVVTFLDGGVGHVQIASQIPILLRVGSYCVRTGERRLEEREQFGYYPIILGDLEGGSKERKDFIDIVRISAELLGALAALERTADLDVLFLHGPLVYHVGAYAGHTPFTEHDIDLFLCQYAADAQQAHQLKHDFLEEARLDIYPRMTDRSEDWAQRRLFEPLAWIAFLYRRLSRRARERAAARGRPVIIAGVVERSSSREFSERVMLERVFRGLRRNDRAGYFNEMYGRTDLTTPKALLDRLGYTDTLLLAMLLRPGEYTESWLMDKYAGLRQGDVVLPGEVGAGRVNFGVLQAGPFGFPPVLGTYLAVSETTEPLRVETFADLGADGLVGAVERAWLYARLLPGYGFPVGLDIADKFAHVPAWLTEAYGKLVRYQLGVSLQRGEISDAEMRRILVQAIYMTHRDWLFRPTA
ncbi:MAG: DNA double-strand break repair nuclease NurA [Thermomicrobiales bacterium]